MNGEVQKVDDVSLQQSLVLRCHDISIGLGRKDVPEFEVILEAGLMVRLA